MSDRPESRLSGWAGRREAFEMLLRILFPIIVMGFLMALSVPALGAI